MRTTGKTIITGLCALAVFACTGEVQDEKISPINAEAPLMTAKLRIMVTEELSSALMDAADDENGIPTRALGEAGTLLGEGVKLRNTFMIGGPYEKRQREAGLHLWFDVDLPETKATEGTLSSLAEIEGVEIVEQIPKIVMRSIPNDPMFTNQWHYFNNDPEHGREGADIGLARAWERYGIYGSSDVIVAVLDGGVDCSHEDLIGNLWINEGEIPGNGIDDDGNGYIDDIHGINCLKISKPIEADEHGTHVAGTIAAVNNNGIGVSGVAGGNYPTPGARIMSLQIFENNKGGNTDAIAFQYAAENGASIAQCSWGFDGISYLPASTKRAIDYFIDNAGLDPDGNQIGPMRGGIAIFAAGNEARDISYPAAYQRVLAVGSIGRRGRPAYYTNYGPWVDVTAPGGDQKEDYMSGGIYSTLPGNSYGAMQGTSMACPHASGIAALVLSKAAAPGYTADKLFQHLVESCDPVLYEWNPTWKDKLGKGLIRADRALALFSTEAPDPVQGAKAVIKCNQITISGSVPKDPDDCFAAALDIYVAKKAIQDCADNEYEIIHHELQTEDTFEIVMDNLDFDTDYFLAIKALDYAGNESELTDFGKLHTGINNPPSISSTTEGRIRVRAFETAIIPVSINEPDGHSFSLTFDNKGNSAAEFFSVSETEGIIRIEGPRSNTGQFSCSLKAEDSYGASSVLAIEYEVTINHAPVVSTKPEDIFSFTIDESITLDPARYFADPDGDELAYTVTISDKTVASCSFSSGKYILKTVGAGITSIKIEASDGAGESVSQTFDLYVILTSAKVIVTPSPVIATANIKAVEEGNYHAEIISPTGSKVATFDGTISMHTPWSVDMSGCAPGNYTAIISGNGVRHSTQFVKL